MIFVPSYTFALFPITLAVILMVGLPGCGSESEKEADTSKPMATVDTTALPSLNAVLSARRAAFKERAPQELVAAFEYGVELVRQSGVLETALKVGDTAPVFTLPNATGVATSLTFLLAKGPVVLTWYRGGWCPYCNLQLRAYQQALPEFQKFGASLVAVSPEMPDSSLSTSERDSLGFEVLSDVGNNVADEYGIVYTVPDTVLSMFKGHIDLAAYNGEEEKDRLPLAVTYVIDTDGVIAYAFISADYTKRAEPKEIVEALAGL